MPLQKVTYDGQNAIKKGVNVEFKEELKSGIVYIKTFIKWLVLSVAVGLVCGAVGVAFHHAVEIVTEYRLAHSWVLFTLPLIGVVIALMYAKAGMLDDKGTNGIFDSVRNGVKVKGRLAPLIFIGATLTHLGGGSAGREGAALQMGGSVGSTMARLFKLKEKDYKIMMICGMSAVFSALFETPLTATIFCLEVINVGVYQYAALMPALSSALTAYAFAVYTGITPMVFPLPGSPVGFQLPVVGTVVLLSFLCGLVSILLCETMHISAKLYKKYVPNPYIRGAVGGVLVILFTLVEGSGDYNGAGMNLVVRAVSGDKIVPWAFLLKLLLTGITLGAGFKGGEIVPTLCIGATFGSAMGVLLG
ncbi:MAG: chloride channel protein, partial [Oscillospiraceae bacterium]